MGSSQVKIIANKNPDPLKCDELSLHMKSLYDRFPLSHFLDHSTGKEKEIPWEGQTLNKINGV
jgi:hypothetical protein